MISISVFCGSSEGNDKGIIDTAYNLGATLAINNITLVYGASRIGIMGKVAQGAIDKKGKTIGVIPNFLRTKEIVNNELTELIVTQNMHDRKVVMYEKSDGFMIIPGGFGTMDELFETLTLVQTKKIDRFPIILMGKDFWSPMMDWIKKTMAEDYKTISPGDLDLIHLTDDVEEVVDVIAEFYKQASLRPNF